MSSASTPSAAGSPAPQPVRPQPEIVRQLPRKPRKAGVWVVLAILAAGAAAFYLKTSRANSASGKNSTTVMRTAGIAAGDVERTIRISGTIQAEKFATVLAPQIRGSRSDRGRMYSSTASVGTVTPATVSSSTSSTDTSSSAASSATSSSSIGATRGTTNRFSDMSGANTKGDTSAPRASSASGLTSTNLGSTGANLLSPSRSGPSGGSDFTLVLVKCAPAGGHVKTGDAIAEFDRQYQLNRLDDYKASVAQQEANITKLKADQAVTRKAHDQLVYSAKADWEKAKLDLQTISVRSAIEGEDFKLAEQEAAAHYQQILAEVKPFEEGLRAELHRTELDRDQAKIELQRAQLTVDRMEMKSTMNGVVVMQTIFRGGDFGQVQAGDQISSGVVFMTIVDPSSMVLNATVSQVDSEEIRAGMKATVHLDAYPDLALPARVIAVGAMTDSGGMRANWVRSIPVRLKLDAVDPRVIPDLSGSADVVLAEQKQAAIAPRESIFRDGPDGRPYVFVETPAGFVRREVELGLASNTAVAVRSGLRQGEVIALTRPADAQAQGPPRTP